MELVRRRLDLTGNVRRVKLAMCAGVAMREYGPNASSKGSASGDLSHRGPCTLPQPGQRAILRESRRGTERNATLTRIADITKMIQEAASKVRQAKDICSLRATHEKPMCAMRQHKGQIVIQLQETYIPADLARQFADAGLNVVRVT